MIFLIPQIIGVSLKRSASTFFIISFLTLIIVGFTLNFISLISYSSTGFYLDLRVLTIITLIISTVLSLKIVKKRDDISIMKHFALLFFVIILACFIKLSNIERLFEGHDNLAFIPYMERILTTNNPHDIAWTHGIIEKQSFINSILDEYYRVVFLRLVPGFARLGQTSLLFNYYIIFPIIKITLIILSLYKLIDKKYYFLIPVFILLLNGRWVYGNMPGTYTTLMILSSLVIMHYGKADEKYWFLMPIILVSFSSSASFTALILLLLFGSKFVEVKNLRSYTATLLIIAPLNRDFILMPLILATHIFIEFNREKNFEKKFFNRNTLFISIGLSVLGLLFLYIQDEHTHKLYLDVVLGNQIDHLNIDGVGLLLIIMLFVIILLRTKEYILSSKVIILFSAPTYFVLINIFGTENFITRYMQALVITMIISLIFILNSNKYIENIFKKFYARKSSVLFLPVCFILVISLMFVNAVNGVTYFNERTTEYKIVEEDVKAIVPLGENILLRTGFEFTMIGLNDYFLPFARENFITKDRRDFTVAYKSVFRTDNENFWNGTDCNSLLKYMDAYKIKWIYREDREEFVCKQQMIEYNVGTNSSLLYLVRNWD